MADEIKFLESELERLRRAMSYPEAPALAAAVRRRLAVAEKAPASRWGRALAPALAALVAIVAAAAISLALSSGAREAVADFFDRIRIFQTRESPAELPREIGGTPVTLEEARERAGFTPLEATYPEGVRLRETLLQEFEGFTGAVLFYEHPSGLSFALFETSGAVGKGVPVGLAGAPSAEAEPVAGVGDEAYWLSGLRIVEFYDDQGKLIRESRRATEANTLLWEAGGLVFRIEGDLPQDQAVRIAQSLR